MAYFSAFGLGMGLFEIAFFVMFALIVVVIVVVIVKGVSTNAKNQAAPQVSAEARVVTKRIETHGGGETMVSQHHFVTFEQSGGERFELEVPASEFGMLVEGDRGTVSMKGTRYLGFSRELMR